MRIKRLPVDTGKGGWQGIAKRADAAAELDSSIVADFLIIGAGFAGLSAARRLVQLKPDARIIVLDARKVGEGPAGRNSGFMIDLPHKLSSTDYAGSLENDRKQIHLNRCAIKFAREAAIEFKMPGEAFRQSGKINGAVTAKAEQHNEAYAQHLDALGESYKRLDRQALRKLTGSGFYSSGLFTPGTALLQPFLYTTCLARGLAKQVSIFENSPVIELTRDNASWVAQTPRGAVWAEKTIIATNGHIESFGHFRRRVFHIILFASMTRRLSETEDRDTGKESWGITPADPVATTIRKHAGRGGTRIITRNQMRYAPDLQTNGEVLDKMAQLHAKSFAKRYPALSEMEQEYVWAGRLCLSRNSAPAFGQIEDGLYAACCQNGLGTTRGTLSGIAAAEYAVEGQTDLVRAHLEAGRPTRLPLFPLDVIGANAIMRWKEFGARREL